MTPPSGNDARLVAAKRRWDPGNLFRMNQNIRPESWRLNPGSAAVASRTAWHPSA